MNIRPYTEWGYYNNKQKRQWNVLLDAYNALEFGFQRFAKPGTSVNVDKAVKHLDSMEKEWRLEWENRDHRGEFSGPPKLTSLPLDTKVYIHEVLGGFKKQ